MLEQVISCVGSSNKRIFEACALIVFMLGFVTYCMSLVEPSFFGSILNSQGGEIFTRGSNLVTQSADGLISILLGLCTFVSDYWESLEISAHSGTPEGTNAVTRFLGSLGTLGGAYILFKNFQVARDSLEESIESNKRNAKIAESRLISERFSQAIEHVANEDIHIRLGGIYSLKKIAEDSPTDYWTVMEVLTAFVRHQSALTDCETQRGQGLKVATDIQSALTVIASHNFNRESGVLNDRGMLDLSETFLSKANLRGALLNGVNLQGVYLRGANLQDADFKNADLTEADLSNANLRDTDFTSADLTEADLGQANLSGAIFKDANLTFCKCMNVSYPSQADFRGAILWGVKLSGFFLNRPDRLSKNQLEGDNPPILYKTILPPGNRGIEIDQEKEKSRLLDALDKRSSLHGKMTSEKIREGSKLLVQSMMAKHRMQL